MRSSIELTSRLPPKRTMPTTSSKLALFINGYTRQLTMPRYGFHRHAHMIISYIKSGAGTSIMPDGRETGFTKNDLFIYWPNTIHAVNIARPCEEIVLKLDPVGLHTTGDELHPHYINGLDDEFLLLEIMRLSRPGSGSGVVSNLRATALLFELLKIEPENSGSGNATGLNAKLEEVKDYLEDHFRSIFSVAEAAEKLDLSYEYIRHRFKEKYAISMKQYLMKVRIDHAKWLLSNSRTPLAEVAGECGFDNERYFCTRFRKETGSTPGIYRKRSQGFGFI